MDVLINRKTRVETIISNREKDVDEVIVELTEQEHKLLLEKLTNITPERVFDVLAELGINIYWGEAMRITEIELEPTENITIVVNKEDYDSFIEDTNDIIESNIPEDDGYYYTDDFLEALFDKLGIEVLKRG